MNTIWNWFANEFFSDTFGVILIILTIGLVIYAITTKVKKSKKPK
jgi:hypothetical protein